MNEERIAIEVYCDDPRHVRSRVAEIAVLLPIGTGRYEKYLATFDKRSRPQHRRRPGISKHLDEGNREHYELSCPLCPRRPQFTNEQFQALAIGLSNAGQMRVSLTLLDAHAARIVGDEGVGL